MTSQVCNFENPRIHLHSWPSEEETQDVLWMCWHVRYLILVAGKPKAHFFEDDGAAVFEDDGAAARQSPSNRNLSARILGCVFI